MSQIEPIPLDPAQRSKTMTGRRRSVLGEFYIRLPVKERPRFAKRVGIRPRMLMEIAYGYRPCNPWIAIAIDRESDGAVPFWTMQARRHKADWNYLRRRYMPQTVTGE